MKIAIATGPMLPVPPQDGGAMVRAMVDLAVAMYRSGHTVTLLSCQRAGQCAQENWQGIEIHRSGGFSQSRSLIRDLLLDARDAWHWRKRIPECDVLITNDIFLPIVLQSRKRRFSILATVARWPKAHLYLYGGVDRLAAISRPVCERIAELHPGLRDRTVVLPIGFDESVFRIVNSGQRNHYAYVGRIHPEKGVHLLVEAYRLLGSAAPQLRLIGPSEPSQGGGGPHYLRHLKSLAAGHNVQFVGAIFERDLLAAELNQARVFVYPSLASQGEALGLAPIEAMACGAVPVVSSLPCFSDFIRHGVSGFIFDQCASNAAQILADRMKTAWNQSTEEGLQIACAQSADRYRTGALVDRWLEACKDAIKLRQEP